MPLHMHSTLLHATIHSLHNITTPFHTTIRTLHHITTLFHGTTHALHNAVYGSRSRLASGGGGESAADYQVHAAPRRTSVADNHNSMLRRPSATRLPSGGGNRRYRSTGNLSGKERIFAAVGSGVRFVWCW